MNVLRSFVVCITVLFVFSTADLFASGSRIQAGEETPLIVRAFYGVGVSEGGDDGSLSSVSEKDDGSESESIGLVATIAYVEDAKRRGCAWGCGTGFLFGAAMGCSAAAAVSLLAMLNCS